MEDEGPVTKRFAGRCTIEPSSEFPRVSGASMTVDTLRDEISLSGWLPIPDL